jgi:hypothetical protein
MKPLLKLSAATATLPLNGPATVLTDYPFGDNFLFSDAVPSTPLAGASVGPVADNETAPIAPLVDNSVDSGLMVDGGGIPTAASSSVAAPPISSFFSAGAIVPMTANANESDRATVVATPVGGAYGILADNDAAAPSLASAAPQSTIQARTTGTAVSASVSAGASPFVIKITYDASVNNAPAAFKTVVQSVVQYFESQFTDPVTININVGYGEVDGRPLGSGALGQSLSFLNSYTYAQLRNSLITHSKSADDAVAVATLPVNSPVSGTYWATRADAKALGLLGASTSVDGYVGFASGNLFNYNNSKGVTGQYDFYGVVAHEISEVMGRSLLVGGTIGSTPNGYYPLDLFHYSAFGVRDFVGTRPGYFSFDNGVTDLNDFNTNPGGDFGDWAANAGNDAFLAFSHSGVINSVSQTDLRELDVIGWDRAVARAPVTASGSVKGTAATAAAQGMAAGSGNAGGPGQSQIASGGTIEFTGSANDAVTFRNDGGNGGTLKLDAAESFHGTVAGLREGDSIDLANFRAAGNPSIACVSGTAAAGTTTDVTVTDGALSTTLNLVNMFAGQFAVAAGAYSLRADNATPNAGTLFQLAAHA